jgi:peptide/nickel transport system permease protein
VAGDSGDGLGGIFGPLAGGAKAGAVDISPGGTGPPVDLARLAPPGVADLVPDGEGGAAGALDASARRIRREHLRQLLHSKTFIVGAVILLWWIVCAVFGPTIAPQNPLAQNLLNINAAPSSAHWFGTDALGRDMFSRVIVGARQILIIATLATLLGTVAGTALGLVQGFFRGIVDSIVGRIVDAVLALPIVIIAFLFIVATGPSTTTLIVVIGFGFALVIARTVRTAVLQERELDYVAAARLRDERSSHIMFVEILPNVLAPVLVEFTVRLGYAIFAVATLSFLGFGVQPPTPDWGADIAANYQYLPAGYWWEVLFPAIAIASLIVAVNLISDALEAVLIQ